MPDIIKNEQPNQAIKADAGKPRLTLVPLKILTAIARVREYGVMKYKTITGWKNVGEDRYRDALFRHFVAYIENPEKLDEESGLPHLWQVACNAAFLTELSFDKLNALFEAEMKRRKETERSSSK